MTAEAWRTLSQTLDRLLDLPEPSRRQAIDQLRESNPDLCREVESLLAEHDSQDRLEAPPSELLDQLPETPDEPQFDQGKAGRYVIQDEIARGGMGAIYRALDTDIGRLLAVKVLLPRARIHPDVEHWFDREACITGRLQHPGIPPLHERGRLADGSRFFVMKLIEGRTLAEAMLDPDWRSRCIGVFEQISSAVAYAHSQGVIHRDLKPVNVMVGRFGEVQVMDWGLARSLRGTSDGFDDAAEDDPGSVAGTPAYMAPEQARGDRDLDERCDVFGLGALLCAMMTGNPPYREATQQQTLESATRADTYGALESMAAAGADADLLAIASRCLAAKRDQRYRHAGEVAEAITTYRANLAERLRQTELAREKAVVKAAEERRRRRVTMSLLVSLCLLAIGAAGVWAWQDRLKSQKTARASELNGQIARAIDDAEIERTAMTGALADPQAAHRLLGNLQPWQARLLRIDYHAQQARKLANSDVELLTTANAGRLSVLEARLVADRADYDFAEQLDRLRLELFDPGIMKQPGVVDRGYRKLFESRGIRVARNGSSPDEDLASQLAESPLRFVAVAALDDWSSAVTFASPRDDAMLAGLLAAARRLDPDPWRDRFREPAVWIDAKKVAGVTGQLSPSEQSPQILRVAAGLRWQHRLDATALLTQSLRVYPADFWLLYQYGIVTLFSDSAATHSAFRGALALRPRNAFVLNNFGIASTMRQDYATAEDAFRQAFELRPGYADAVCNLAKCRYEQGDYAGAIADYGRAHELEPDLVETFNGLGVAQLCRGEFDEAWTTFDNGLKLSPANAGLLEKQRMVNDILERRAKVRAAERDLNTTWETLRNGIADVLTMNHPIDCFHARTDHRRSGYRVELKAGSTYQFDLSADFDPLLRIEDDHFRPLLLNNDQRPGLTASRLIFTPETTGHFRLVATSSEAGRAGGFTLRGRMVKPSGEPLIRTGTLTRKDTVLQNRYLHKHAATFTAGQPVVITLRSSAFNTRLWLMDGDAKTYIISAEKMHPFDGHWSRLDFTPAKTESFQIIVTTAEMDRIGGYSLTVEACQAFETVTGK